MPRPRSGTARQSRPSAPSLGNDASLGERHDVRVERLLTADQYGMGGHRLPQSVESLRKLAPSLRRRLPRIARVA